MDNTLPKKMAVGPAAKPLKIAVVYTRIPFPMVRGDQLTVAHVVEFLSRRGHAVDFYTLDSDGELSEDQKAFLQGACRKLRIYPQGTLAKLRGLVLGFLRLRPAQVGLFDNPALAAEVRAGIEAGDYDIVYVYYIRSAPVLTGGFGPRIATVKGGRRVAAFLALQLSQILNSKRIYLAEKKNLLRKFIYFVEWQLLRRYETTIWRRYTHALLIGPQDVAALKSACAEVGRAPIDNWLYGAHGTDVEKFQPAKPEEIVANRVIFSGNMQYQPNVQAVLWFVAECWPQIRTARPDAEFFIQGRDPIAAIRALESVPGVKVVGTVPDVGPLIRSSAVCVNPMLAAGGMQNKLIEYLACGKAVVASTVANEGIGAKPGVHLMIADDAEAMAKAVVDLLDDSERRSALGAAGRAFVMENWTWEHHFLKLEENFYRALEVPAG